MHSEVKWKFWNVECASPTWSRMVVHSRHILLVKAHQDDTASYDELPVESQLNVQADTLAKDYNSSSLHATTTVPRLSCNAAQLHCRGQTVTSRYGHTVRQEALSPAICQYIMERNHWSAADMETVH
jgi:hypothetical protein